MESPDSDYRTLYGGVTDAPRGGACSAVVRAHASAKPRRRQRPAAKPTRLSAGALQIDVSQVCPRAASAGRSPATERMDAEQTCHFCRRLRIYAAISSISSRVRCKSGIRECGVAKKARRDIAVVELMSATAANGGAPVLVPRSCVGPTTWQVLHQVSASLPPADGVGTCCAARLNEATDARIAVSNGIATHPSRCLLPHR